MKQEGKANAPPVGAEEQACTLRFQKSRGGGNCPSPNRYSLKEHVSATQRAWYCAFLMVSRNTLQRDHSSHRTRVVIKRSYLSDRRWSPWSPQKVKVETSRRRFGHGRMQGQHLGGLVVECASQEWRGQFQLDVRHRRWRGNCGNECIVVPAAI